ncbi:PepSY-like domain-containing protein [Chitinophaga sancti]|uniref:PepSY-like domain-containing protein n=1 Tax=Chitinophaga sancti TaxID=1004 RepID=UPI003F79CC64
MIKSNALLLVALLPVLSLFAQDAPKPAVSAFQKNFPAATKAKWEKEKNDYEVIFNYEGKEMSAVFTKSGQFLEKEEVITAQQLPAKVSAYLKQHYNNAVIKETAKITKADGSIQYEAEVNKKDLIFNGEGELVK